MKIGTIPRARAAVGLLIAILALTATQIAAVEIPGQISYQGRLTDADGAPLNDTVEVIAAIYDSETGGIALWSETHADVIVGEGLFSLTLGANTSIPSDIFAIGPRFLSLTIDGGEIDPRTRLIAVPYSFVSAVSDSAEMAADIPDGSVTEAKILDRAVTGDKLDQDAVDSEHIVDGAIESGEIAADAVTSDKIEDGAVGVTELEDLSVSTEKLSDGAVDSSKIADGSILFIDLNQNGASAGQVIKWNGSTWAAGHDDIGIVSGWMDYGRVISLQNLADSVGIGTSTPQAKLDVEGGIRVADDMAVGGSVEIADTATDNISLQITKSVDGAAIAVDSTDGARQGHSFVVYRDGRVGIGTDPAEALEVAGTIHSTTGGYKFPDGSVQTSAAMDDVTWEASGAHVVLESIGDSVGIGTAMPTEKLSVEGGVSVSANVTAGGKLNVGQSNTNPGTFAMVLGSNNQSSGNYSTVAGGASNQALNQYTAVGGGLSNSAVGSHAVVSGGQSNLANDQWSYVGGGSLNHADRLAATVSGGYADTASGIYSFVGGGQSNRADGSRASVAGGQGNKAFGGSSAIGGGLDNYTSGKYSVIPGGRNCHVLGDYGFAVGRNARANHISSFVLSANYALFDSDTVATGRDEQIVMRADGGIYITNQSETAPDDLTRLINTSTGAYLSSSGVWTNASDSSLKENFTEVDGEEILARLLDLDIKAWNYRSAPDARHIGPTAQEFSRAFGLGADDRSISTIDPAGVALVAIQELHKKTKEIDDLKAQVADLQKIVKELAAERSARDQ